MKNLLILGGTNFIGRNLIEKLLLFDKYSITLYNRGITNTNLFPQLDFIKGDRQTDDIKKINTKTWDYIIDLSCYFPDSLQNLLNQIGINAEKYIFISTCSVYNMNAEKITLRDETSPILECSDKERKSDEVITYGNRKAECERILMKSGINYSILRPALVYGKYDNTDRFYYWLYQVHKESQFLLPISENNLFSITYVHDLVEIIIQSLDKIESNTYNISSTPKCSIKNIIDSASNLMGIKAQEVGVNSKFLHDNEICEWIDIPLWLDNDFYTYDNSKLLRDYDFKPTNLGVSIKQTIEYYALLNWYKPKFGIHEDKINELIQANNNANTNKILFP